jgi:hypothetical protein
MVVLTPAVATITAIAGTFLSSFRQIVNPAFSLFISGYSL